MARTCQERCYPESTFGGFTDVDGTIAFFCRVNALLDSSFTVLDVGCGSGSSAVADPVPFRRSLRILKGKAARVIGIDVDAAAQANPIIDEFRLIQGESWPVDADTVDLVLCDSVLEHLEHPETFFSESHRVLRNGGFICLRTSNKWSYVAIAARLIPNRYHARVTGAIQTGREETDVFPTRYRCNSAGKIRRLLSRHGFDRVVYGYEAEPSYLSFSCLAYWLGVLHQRFSPRLFKATLFAFGKVRK